MKKKKSNKKKNEKNICKIIYYVVGIALVSIVITVLIMFYGTPYGYIKANKNINKYEEKLVNVNFDLFNESKIYYNFKDGYYFKKYIYKTQPLLSFSIACNSKKGNDDYEFNFIEGINALAILGNNIRNEKLSDYEEK